MAGRRDRAQERTADRVGTICRALRQAIIEQALAPGALLPEDAIGARFGVSRTIARHALGQLAAEGLVELRRNRRAVVATPSWAEARDLYDIRIGVEGLVVHRLAGQLDARRLASLRSHVDAEEAARGGPDGVSIRLATEFHVQLAAMTDSPILTRYAGELAYRCCLVLTGLSRPHSAECAINEHRQLIDALADGDAARATALMRAHLEAVAGRALVAQPPARGRDLMTILAPYAASPPRGAAPSRRRAAVLTGKRAR